MTSDGGAREVPMNIANLERARILVNRRASLLRFRAEVEVPHGEVRIRCLTLKLAEHERVRASLRAEIAARLAPIEEELSALGVDYSDGGWRRVVTIGTADAR